MQFNLTVVAVETKSATSKAGKPYQMVEIAYKNNTFQGKIESSKVNQYSPLFKQAAAMQPGQTYTVEKEKDASGYYQWLSMVQSVPGVVPGPAGILPTPASTGGAVAAVAQAKNDYAEADARKQIYIVKQSSIKHAIDLLSVGAKTPPSTQSVLEQAQKFVDYVFEDKPLSMDDMTKLPNDIDVQVE